LLNKTNSLLKEGKTLMEALWIVISVVALVVIAVLLLVTRGRPYRRPSNLAILGMAMVALGIIFGDDRLVGYSFIGVGVVLSVFGAIRDRRNS